MVDLTFHMTEMNGWQDKDGPFLTNESYFNAIVCWYTWGIVYFLLIVLTLVTFCYTVYMIQRMFAKGVSSPVLITRTFIFDIIAKLVNNCVNYICGRPLNLKKV